MEAEDWRAVVGYEGKYEVSNRGAVRALYREQEFMARWGIAKMRFPAKNCLLSTSTNGYKYVTLCKDAHGRKHLVHRLVMAAFEGESKLQVNHKDGDKANNFICNLEYCTSLQNLRHCIDVLGKKRGLGTGRAKVSEEDVKAIREDGRILREIAADYGITLQAVHLIKKRKNWGYLE